MITVANLFLIVNIIIFIQLLILLHFKKIRIFRDDDIRTLAPSILFIISLASIVFQGIILLVTNWNSTIG